MSEHLLGLINQDIGSVEAPMIAPHVAPINAKTRPEKVIILPDKRYYVCTIPNASMHTKDGTRIPFVGGFLETQVKSVINYLDSEISGVHKVYDKVSGSFEEQYQEPNIYIREATDLEVNTAMMRRDPRGTMEKKVREEMVNDPTVRAEIEAQIRAELLLAASGKAVDTSAPATEYREEANTVDAAKIAGTTTTQDALQRLREGKLFKVPGATVAMTQATPRLQGIVSSADISDAAAGSGGQTGNL